MSGCNGQCACNDDIPSKSLLACIDTHKVSAINEQQRGSCLEILLKSHAERHSDTRAFSKDSNGLVLKIPFTHKVSITKIEIKSTFKQIDLIVNNQYITLDSKPKNLEKYCLTGDSHIVPIVLPAYKYRSVDCLTIRLKEPVDNTGSLSYLCVSGAITGSLPTPVNVSYELYPIPEDTKSITKESSNLPLH
ncbi:hypothetical protein NEOKW01_1350 [Nematocida sp. AWRm80]|nr:hypothetical protein NEOKW01_1350 [Nematocida sp. AWRm80]